MIRNALELVTWHNPSPHWREARDESPPHGISDCRHAQTPRTRSLRGARGWLRGLDVLNATRRRQSTGSTCDKPAERGLIRNTGSVPQGDMDAWGFELQAWLGHRSPQSTQHYTQITPTRLAQAYADAGYFARNLRTIEVLIDREAVQSGAAAGGTPWQYFDLGHGYCTYNFFEQCPHRMACARCDFYVPKASAHAQLVEAKGHPAAHADDDPADRSRTRGRRRRRRRRRAAPHSTGGRPDASGPDAPGDPGTPGPLLTIGPLRQPQGA